MKRATSMESTSIQVCGNESNENRKSREQTLKTMTVPVDPIVFPVSDRILSRVYRKFVPLKQISRWRPTQSIYLLLLEPT